MGDGGEGCHDGKVRDLARFDHHLREWAAAVCTEHDAPPVGADWFEAVHRRLPPGLRVTLGQALADDVITTIDGWGFGLAGVDEQRAPFRWFHWDDSHGVPVPNWKYFVQVAEYARLRAAAYGTELSVAFEDQLSPRRVVAIALFERDALVWSLEVCEKVVTAGRLSRAVAEVGETGVPDEPDPGDEAADIAHHLCQNRPPFVSFLGIGGRFDWSTVFHDQRHFELHADVVPYG